MSLQLFLFLFVLILAIHENRGSSGNEETILLDSQCVDDDKPVYWDNEGQPSHEPSLHYITDIFINRYYEDKIGKWTELAYDSHVTYDDDNKWNEFCYTIWKMWKPEEELSFDSYFEYLPYINTPQHKVNLVIDCREHVQGFKVEHVDLLGCFCKERDCNNDQRKKTDHSNSFYLAKGSTTTEYFILQKSSSSSISDKTLFFVGYIPDTRRYKSD